MQPMKKLISVSCVTLFLVTLNSCISKQEKKTILLENTSQTIRISKETYQNQLYGFWLGQCIANWTGW
jgi:hypothetical protein